MADISECAARFVLGSSQNTPKLSEDNKKKISDVLTDALKNNGGRVPLETATGLKQIPEIDLFLKEVTPSFEQFLNSGGCEIKTQHSKDQWWSATDNAAPAQE